MKTFIPDCRRRIKLRQDWTFTLIKHPFNSQFLKDYVKIKQNSFKLTDLEKWRATPNTLVTLLSGTVMHVMSYKISSTVSVPSKVVLHLRDTYTNSWTPAQRKFWVLLDDFNGVDMEYFSNKKG